MKHNKSTYHSLSQVGLRKFTNQRVALQRVLREGVPLQKYICPDVFHLLLVLDLLCHALVYPDQGPHGKECSVCEIGVVLDSGEEMVRTKLELSQQRRYGGLFGLFDDLVQGGNDGICHALLLAERLIVFLEALFHVDSPRGFLFLALARLLRFHFNYITGNYLCQK